MQRKTLIPRKRFFIGLFSFLLVIDNQFKNLRSILIYGSEHQEIIPFFLKTI
jgi:hypothetical protein